MSLSVTSVFIVQCNTSLSKNYVSHSVTVVCVVGLIWEKNRLVCTLWFSVHMKSVVEQGFSTNSHSTTKRSKHLSSFKSVENVQSSNVVEFEFALCHISGGRNCFDEFLLRTSYCIHLLMIIDRSMRIGSTSSFRPLNSILQSWSSGGYEWRSSELFRTVMCTTIVHDHKHTHSSSSYSLNYTCWFVLEFCVCS